MTEPNVAVAVAVPAAPTLDLSHEHPAIAEAMAVPAFMNENAPGHKDAVERVFALRQNQTAVQAVQAAQTVETPGRVEPESVYAQPVSADLADTPTGDYTKVAWPDAVVAPARTATAIAARDFQIGASELNDLMKSAAPFLADNVKYDYAGGERALRAQLGEKADAVLSDAKAYVQEHPGLLEWLTVRGLASHPGAIRVFAERFQARAKLQTRLKEIQADPDYLGGRDHAKHARLVDEAFSVQRALHE